MSYVVLARKHRPQEFDSVIGQEHITDLLCKSIKAGRLAQAYLFCGPRGVGKTTCARIIAKCLNCEQGPTVEPCGQCSACQEIAKGSSFDVLEIDGASNRGIDEIRSIRENVKFAPSYGRYKIYIVDEVHMLTNEAFNALLKTLEEPPEHVKFIFATTGPNKVPATIISRCQRFDFKRVSLNTIADMLAGIATKEALKIDQDALFAIAKAAQGSLRDALSILDQLSALSDDGVVADDVFSMLGLVETQLLFELSAALCAKDCGAALTVLENILSKGKDVKQLLRDITEHYRNLMVIKIGGKAMGRLVDHPVAIKEDYLGQAAQFNLSDILKSIDAFIEAQDIARVTESVQMPLELAFAKLTYQEGHTAPATRPQPKAPAIQTAPPTVQPAPPKPVAPASQAAPAAPMTPKATTPVSTPVSTSSEAPASQPSPSSPSAMVQDVPEEVEEVVEELGGVADEDPVRLDLETVNRVWDTLTHAVSRHRMSVATYLQEGSPVAVKGEQVTIGFTREFKFNKEALEDQGNLMMVSKVFAEKLRTNVVLKYTLVEEQAPRAEDSDIANALNAFEGKVVNRWHNE